MEERRTAMLSEFETLKNERERILEERNLLYERMEKIEKLQQLQRLYQAELHRLRSETAEREEEEQHKEGGE